MPEQDKDLMTRSEMIARLVMAMGGRAAEELVFHEPTTGASSDIDQATKIARAMVTEYGASSKPWRRAVRGQEQGDPFSAGPWAASRATPDEVAAQIDEGGAPPHRGRPQRGVGHPRRSTDTLDVLASELLEKETPHPWDLEADLRRCDQARPHH